MAGLNKRTRLWVMMLFVGPGVFFILYWFMTIGAQDKPLPRVVTPQSYYMQGETVQLGKSVIQAGLAGKNIVRKGLKIRENNYALAGPGKSFLIVPVFSRDSSFSAGDFELLSRDGNRYRHLKVHSKYLVRAAKLSPEDIPAQMDVHYLIFEIDIDKKIYYLIYKDNKEVTWRFTLQAATVENKNAAR